MSALSKATRKESDAYQAMTDASADVVARVLEGIDDDVTDRLRRRAQSLRKEWQAAARVLEAVTMRHWDYVEQGDRIIERRGLVRR